MKVATIAMLACACSLAFVACGGAQNQAADPPPALAIPPMPRVSSSSDAPVHRAPLAIVFDERRLAVKGEEIARPWRVGELHALLGEPSRLLHMANELHVYDDLGIVLYEHTGSGVVNSVSVYYAPMEYVFTPQTMFVGDLRVGGVDIDGRTTGSKLFASVPFQWEGEYGGWRNARFQGGSVAIARNVETDALLSVQLSVEGGR